MSHLWFVRSTADNATLSQKRYSPKTRLTGESVRIAHESSRRRHRRRESSVGAGENSLAENADVSMIDRSMDDAVA